jgi:hypothetical protein
MGSIEQQDAYQTWIFTDDASLRIRRLYSAVKNAAVQG